MNLVSPREIFKQVAIAVPRECHKNIIIIGSLAVGYHFFGNKNNRQVRTKDIDCVLFPRIQAIELGTILTQQLFDNGWRQREEGDHWVPGNSTTPDNELPAVRLYPPNSKEWFLELMTIPESEHDEGKQWTRLTTSKGDYGLPSFRFLSLITFKPIETTFGISYARPEMMALANMLEHPEIKSELMSGLIAERRIKRSNKDLGRALAIAWLSDGREMETWMKLWMDSLRHFFPTSWNSLIANLGRGIKMLVENEEELEEALFTCQNGLLSTHNVTRENLRIAGKRLIQDVVIPLENRLINNGF